MQVLHKENLYARCEAFDIKHVGIAISEAFQDMLDKRQMAKYSFHMVLCKNRDNITKSFNDTNLHSLGRFYPQSAALYQRCLLDELVKN